MSSILTILRQRRHRRDQVRSSAQQRSQRTILGFGFIFSVAVFALVLAAALVYASLTRGLPSLEKMTVLLDPQDGQLLQPTRLYDRTGQHLIAALSPTGSPRTYIAYDRFPQALVDATLALTQPDFWTSPGYLLKGWQDPRSHPTLAQRLVFDFLLWDQPASSLRAIHERILAAQVTAEYGSRQVLEWYLNSADYGHLAYGAEAAAQLYFGKSVTQLDLSEAALLAAVSQAPALNPIDSPSAAEQRRVQTLIRHAGGRSSDLGTGCPGHGRASLYRWQVGWWAGGGRPGIRQPGSLPARRPFRRRAAWNAAGWISSPAWITTCSSRRFAPSRPTWRAFRATLSRFSPTTVRPAKPPTCSRLSSPASLCRAPLPVP